MTTITTGVKLMTNSLKVIPAYEPIMMLGGSPMSVAVPPKFEARISGIRNTNGDIPKTTAISSVTGVKRSMVVTLSRKALVTAVTTQSADERERSFRRLSGRTYTRAIETLRIP